MNQELKIAMQTIRFLDESTNDYLYLYDLINERIYFTDKICQKYPFPPVGNQGITTDVWKNAIYSGDRRRLEEKLKKIREGQTEVHSMEYRLIDQEGNKVWVSCRGRVQKNSEGQPCFLIGSISEMALGRVVDSLTGLWNLERFMEDLGECLKTGAGYLMVLGIDNFKDINVKNGRTFGNYILRKTADILEGHAEYPMKLYRLDGDRFAVLFLKKNKKEIQEYYHSVKRDLDIFCTVSAGAVAYHSSDGQDSGIVYQYAENALDRAKKEGKDTLIFFSAEDFRKSLDRIEFQDELKDAVQNGCKGFYLCYQPQIDGRTFSIYGAEALLRYESKTRGVVSPLDFIPYLEQSGMICPVGLWVLKTAVDQCARWRRIIPNFHINVNISYVQLRQENIAELVLDILREASLPGDALTLEVTESIQLQDYSYFNKIFYQWKRHGIKIAIDDFGTGYSSLSYLKSIDIDETKIDRCFINRIHYNAYNYRLLSNMIELAHSARIQVCCEGVETEEELKALQRLKPDVFQGFLFARPYKKEEFESLYINQEAAEYKERLKREQGWRQMDSAENRFLPEREPREALDSIVENMDEMVYVCDAETRELYYLNPAGRKSTGIYDYKGRKCYQVLHDRNTPCEFCSRQKISEEKTSVRQIEESVTGRLFRIKDRLIPWRGKRAHLCIAEEIMEAGEDTSSDSALPDIQNQSAAWFEDVRENTKLGLWVIHLDEENGLAEMYADKVMNEVMGLEKPLPPQACYAHWYNRINEGYYHYVNLAVENIIQSGKLVQLEYTWKHPARGEVTVRCMGIRIPDCDGKICLQGYHRIISDLERPYFLPGGLNSEMFEYNEKKHTIYFHTDRKMISGESKKEQDFPECWIRDQIVHPHFVEVFREMFTNVQTKDNVRVREILLCSKNGIYEWFKLKTRHLSQKEKDVSTIAVLIEPAEQERTMELEYMRKSDFYEALLSETVAYAEVDVESGHFTMSGGLWESYVDKSRKKVENFNEVMSRHLESVVCSEDYEQYKKHLDLQYLKEMYKKGERNGKYSFRRYVDGCLCWMELVTHVFQDRYTENMYALLYLKNIDAVKKREIARENAAQRDPLTEVYNRIAFEQEVAAYVEKEGESTTGALIILDLDNFKQINDKFGHLKGDETLKAFTEVLKNTFRSHDLIGRLGGDEFLVFVKKVSDRQILNKRMGELFEKLGKTEKDLLACSAGICMITGKNFRYTDEVGKADIALYNSKKKGKNQYSYYDE